MRPSTTPEHPQDATTARAGKPFYLHPGHVFATSEPTLVTTILATCVAICLWDELAGVGGINHYLLASEPPKVDCTPRYGPVAFPRLLDEMVSLGARRRRMQAKVFGGVSRSIRGERPWRDQGTANCEFAFRALHEQQIRVVASDVGGERARKLCFRTDNGDGWVKYL